jgi:hypothetical protein
VDVHRGHRALTSLRLGGALLSVVGGLAWLLVGSGAGGRSVERPGVGGRLLLATDAHDPSFESLFVAAVNGRLP